MHSVVRASFILAWLSISTSVGSATAQPLATSTAPSTASSPTPAAAPADPLTTLLEQFRQEKDPEQSVRIALTLAELSLKESPAASLQFLSLIEARVGFNKQITPFIEYFKARALALSGQYGAALEHLQMVNEFMVPVDLQKKVMELQLDSFAQLGNGERFLDLYDIYAKKFPAYMQLESLRRDAAKAYLDKGNYTRHIQLVESLAEKYPLTEMSRWAFKALESYSCENHDSKLIPERYYFSQQLIQRINWQSSLDAGVDSWVSDQVNRPVRTHEKIVKVLSAKEQIEWLLRLKKFPRALQAIANDRLMNRVAASDAADYKMLEGQAYQGLGDLRKALDLYTTTLAANPKYPRVLIIRDRIAYIYARLGYYAMAADTFGELSKHTLRDRYRWLQFWYNYRAKNYSVALSMLKTFTRNQHPDHDAVSLKYWQARILRRMNKMDDSDRMQREIAQEAPDSFYTIMAVNKDRTLQRYVSALKVTTETLEEPIIATQSDEDDEKTPAAAQPIAQDDVAARTASEVKYSLSGVSGLHDWIMGLQSLATRGGVPTDSNGRFKSLTDGWTSQEYPLAYYDIVAGESQKRALDPLLLLSIIRAESRYRKDALSPVGALGLMQIMPFTAMRIANDLGDGRFQLQSLLDPQSNISYGAFYFGKLLHFYSDNVAVSLAAYNAGPTAVGGWLESCKDCELDEFVDNIPYKETRNYVKKIIGYYSNYKRIHGQQNIVALQQKLPSKFDRSINIY